MRIDIKLNVTPQELRTFFGLPDVQPLQEEMLAQLRARLQSGADELDPLTVMRPFLTPSVGAMETMQKAFWQAFTSASAGESDD